MPFRALKFSTAQSNTTPRTLGGHVSPQGNASSFGNRQHDIALQLSEYNDRTKQFKMRRKIIKSTYLFFVVCITCVFMAFGGVSERF